MKKYRLENGLLVIEEKRPSDSVTIQITIKVGSNFEKSGERGISHFIEHMLFEATKKRGNAREISNQIEKLGGEINAYTDNVRTCFYIKVPKKHFKKAAEILSDIIQNPLFREEDIEKERKVILKEINIFNDDPRQYQWILFQETLYRKHPAKYPAYGTKKDVTSITRDKLLKFHRNYYTSTNSIITVVGTAPDCKGILKNYFQGMKKGKGYKNHFNEEPRQKTPLTKKQKRRIMNSYIVLGYKTPNRRHKYSYALDVIQAILGRGQSGRIFDEIRNKRGLAYEVGVHHEPSTDYGFFSVYLNAHKRNIPIIKKIIIDEFKKLEKIDNKSIKEAVGYIEGKYILDNEDTHANADNIAFWELIGDAKLERDYIKNIKKVKRTDIAKVAKQFLNNNFTMAIIEQEG